MTDQAGVSLRPQDLVDHAGHVAAHADALGTALSAARSTTPGPGSYGYLCVMVPTMLGELQARVVDGISAAGDALTSTATGLRTAAAGYEKTDGQSATAFRRMQQK
jgi:hypothetical protein